MKTNKILIGLTSIVILALGTVSIYTYGGNMQWTQQGISHNPSNMVTNIPTSELTDKEIETLFYGYSEEMVARDMYNYFYEIYQEDVFKRIAESEQEHMNAVKVLLDRYNLDAPTRYGDLQSIFDTLKVQGEQSLQDALGVGLQIEILDIQDIENTIKNTDNEDFKIIFTNIGGASYNHMRAFVRALDYNNLETQIEYSEYLSVNDLNTQGSLQYKLVEKLEAEGVIIPNKFNNNEMKNQKGYGNKGGRNNGENNGIKGFK